MGIDRTVEGDRAENGTNAAAQLGNSGERKLDNGNERRRLAQLNGTANTTADIPDSDLNRSRPIDA